jgi:hypothetical protein
MKGWGGVSGWIFKDKKPPWNAQGFYEHNMFELILRVQATGSVYERLLPIDEKVVEVYGIG